MTIKILKVVNSDLTKIIGNPVSLEQNSILSEKPNANDSQHNPVASTSKMSTSYAKLNQSLPLSNEVIASTSKTNSNEASKLNQSFPFSKEMKKNI